MLKQDFFIKGRYLKAPSSRIYQRLDVSGLPDSKGITLQICDGETLWDFQEILDTKVFRKFSIKPILERLNSPEIDAKTRDQIISRMGFAGPETLLVGLRSAIKFTIKEEATLDGKPVWLLRGTWRTRNGLTGPDQRPVPITGPLPAFIPSTASLYLGKDDGWPYKLLLVGNVPTILKDTRLKGPDGRYTTRKSSNDQIEPSKIELTYSNVQLNPTIRARNSPSRLLPTPWSMTTPRSSSRGSTRPSRSRPCRSVPRLPSRMVPSLTSRSRFPSPPPNRRRSDPHTCPPHSGQLRSIPRLI